MPGVGIPDGSLAGAIRPLIAGLSGSAVSPHLSSWSDRPGIFRPPPAPPPCFPGTGSPSPPLSPNPRSPHPRAGPPTRAIGHTFEFTFSLPKPANTRKPKPRVEPTPEQIEAQKKARRAYEQKRNQTPARKEFKRRVTQERRDKARLLGICVVCGAPSIPDNTRCETCAEKHRVSKRLSQRRARQKAAQQETQASGQTRIF